MQKKKNKKILKSSKTEGRLTSKYLAWSKNILLHILRCDWGHIMFYSEYISSWRSGSCLVCIGAVITTFKMTQGPEVKCDSTKLTNLQVWEPSLGLLLTYCNPTKSLLSPPPEDVQPESPLQFLMPSDSSPTDKEADPWGTRTWEQVRDSGVRFLHGV